MGHIWYYSQNDRPVGPLSFSELKVALAALDRSQPILVWHDGLQSWQDVETFPDLQPVRKPSVTTIAEVRPKSSFSKTWAARLATVFTFALGLTIARHLSQPNVSQSNIQATVINESRLLTGKAREDFIRAGIASCLEKQESAPDNKALHLSRGDLTSYCSCALNDIVDKTTLGELKSYSTDDPRIEEKMKAAGSACIGRFQKKLMGG